MSAIAPESSTEMELARPPKRLRLHDNMEIWTEVTNPVERRKLQNRLNQRARRQRNREKDTPGASSKLSSRKRCSARASSEKSLVEDSSSDTASPEQPTTRLSCINLAPRVQAIMKQFADHALSSYARGTPSLSHLSLLLKYNASSALLQNAEMLGVMSEFRDYDGISPFVKDGPTLGTTSPLQAQDWPATLQPTNLQRSIEHHPWIDLFPWPRLRDNMLRAFEHPDVIDEDDVCRDLCRYDGVESTPGMIVWGSSWDPRSWEVTPGYLAKYGWLFSGCEEILVATNYWRKRRGEKPITTNEFTRLMYLSMPSSLSNIAC